MKAKNIFSQNAEVLNSEQLSKIVGGIKVIVIRDGKPVVIELPD